MVPLDFVLALAVLLAPADAAGAPAPSEHAGLWRTVQAVALALEVLDPREMRGVLARPQDFEADLALIRKRHRELGDAPPVCDAWRFPARELAVNMLAVNRERHRELTLKRQAIGPHPALDGALAECERLYRVWDAVRDARSEFYYVGVRRQALALLRQTLGDPAYHSAHLPPAAPAWFD
jgi:hypothetical protein